MEIKVICFDLDGVYFTPTGKQRFNTYLSEQFGLSDEQILKFHNSDEMKQLVRGQISQQEFFDFFRSYVQSNITNEEITNAWVAGYEIDPKVRQILLSLKSKGYKICACTNNNAIRLGALREKFSEFIDDFDFVVSSHEVGVCKPERKIFEALIQKSGNKPEEILYSDDNSERLKGGQELGISTVVVHHSDELVAIFAKFGITII